MKSDTQWSSLGAVDLHFHGAFGIDIMSAEPRQLDALAEKLGQKGVAAFCATTLSAPPQELKAVVEKLGRWIRRCETEKNTRKPQSFKALPLGIHLEGPFIGPKACGAHPPDSIRAVDLKEIESLWTASQQTLKILTIAPEAFKTGSDLGLLAQFCAERSIILSLGHTCCTEAQAKQALDLGFSGLTHAWNALSFHHRSPGALGAVLGRPKTHVEIILDQIHVSPTLIHWTTTLHEPGYVCFVSDAAPAAETSGEWCSFGPLKIRYQDGASRLESGHLAGGGHILTQSYLRWIENQAQKAGSKNLLGLLKKSVRHITTDPLKALGLPSQKLKGREVVWKVKDNRLQVELKSLSHL